MLSVENSLAWFKRRYKEKENRINIHDEDLERNEKIIKFLIIVNVNYTTFIHSCVKLLRNGASDSKRSAASFLNNAKNYLIDTR